MSELERLDEALEWLDHQPHTEALTAVRGLRKYRDLLANGPLLGLATTRELLDELRARIEVDGKLDYRTVDAAIGGRLLVDPPKEEE